MLSASLNKTFLSLSNNSRKFLCLTSNNQCNFCTVGSLNIHSFIHSFIQAFIYCNLKQWHHYWCSGIIKHSFRHSFIHSYIATFNKNTITDAVLLKPAADMKCTGNHGIHKYVHMQGKVNLHFMFMHMHTLQSHTEHSSWWTHWAISHVSCCINATYRVILFNDALNTFYLTTHSTHFI